MSEAATKITAEEIDAELKRRLEVYQRLKDVGPILRDVIDFALDKGDPLTKAKAQRCFSVLYEDLG